MERGHNARTTWMRQRHTGQFRPHCLTHHPWNQPGVQSPWPCQNKEINGRGDICEIFMAKVGWVRMMMEALDASPSTLPRAITARWTYPLGLTLLLPTSLSCCHSTGWHLSAWTICNLSYLLVNRSEFVGWRKAKPEGHAQLAVMAWGGETSRNLLNGDKHDKHDTQCVTSLPSGYVATLHVPLLP